ncbi:CLUMA_CG002503, isoform A [Clunio marinus]|uniref:CLUMA_CG002503, isoform A n=1 Tax=Clunio marinus TaxID=568069 RepID=A0A1J1HN60_9DIPT|nr:CLUMA_CG002503, isoform A [Clunio marinus]
MLSVMEKTVNKVTIDVVSSDVLIIIFDYLNADDLKNALLVCKNWYEVIVSYASTMSKLPLVFKHWIVDGKPERNDILNFNRNFHTIIVSNTKFNDALVENIVRHCGRTQYFLMKRVIMTQDQFTEIYNSMKFCKNLTIRKSSAIGDLSLTPSGPTFLKTLTLKASDWDFMEILTASGVQVNELKIMDSFDIPFLAPLGTEVFENFLTSQTRLEVLVFYVEHSEMFQFINNYNPHNHLKKLAVYCFGAGRNFVKQFLMLLKAHKSALEELEIDHILNDDILRFIINEMKLKRLKTCYGHVSQWFCSEPDVDQDNIHLKSLDYIFHRYYDVRDDFVEMGLVKYFPAIEKLTLCCPRRDVEQCLTFVAQNCIWLNHLEIFRFYNFMSELTFPCLQTLCIQEIGNVIEYNWKSFFLNNYTIKNLQLGKVSASNVGLLTFQSEDHLIMRMPIDLKYLKFQIQFQLTWDILERMCLTFPNLEELILLYNEGKFNQNHIINFTNFKITCHKWSKSKSFCKRKVSIFLPEIEDGSDEDSKECEDLQKRRRMW